MIESRFEIAGNKGDFLLTQTYIYNGSFSFCRQILTEQYRKVENSFNCERLVVVVVVFFLFIKNGLDLQNLQNL